MNIIVDGLNIEYKITGNGKDTVVILQGWGTDLSMYDIIANALDEKYRIVQFDFPGFGKSDEPKRAWSVDDYSDFFCRFMQEINVEKASLIAHSYGGRVVIKLATRDNIPFEITNIVLIDSAGVMPKRTMRQRFSIYKYKVLKNIFNIGLIEFLFPEIVEDWRNRQGSSDYRNATPVMRQCLVMAVNEDLTHLLPKIKQDTLLIWGENDTATPLSDAKIMEASISNSGLCVIEGAGHFSYIEKPARVILILKSYFGI